MERVNHDDEDCFYPETFPWEKTSKALKVLYVQCHLKRVDEDRHLYSWIPQSLAVEDKTVLIGKKSEEYIKYTVLEVFSSVKTYEEILPYSLHYYNKRYKTPSDDIKKRKKSKR